VAEGTQSKTPTTGSDEAGKPELFALPGHLGFSLDLRFGGGKQKGGGARTGRTIELWKSDGTAAGTVMVWTGGLISALANWTITVEVMLSRRE
jgi:hypothetical protein